MIQYPEVKSYDFIVSLGSACIVADKIQKNNLRLFSGPVDWIVSNPDSTAQFIKSNFMDFLNLDNLKIKAIHDNNTTYLVQDTKYDLLFVHDFLKDIPLSHQYSDLRKKFSRRILNFYRWCSEAESALFVMYFPESDNYLHRIKALELILKEAFPHLDFDLLIVFLSDKKEARILKVMDNAYIAYVYHNESNWTDSDPFWRHILRHFSINFSPGTIELAKLAYLENKRLDFKNTDQFIYTGLAQYESNGRWATGNKTRIGVKVRHTVSSMLVKCSTYKSKYSFVYVNGEYAGTLDFTKKNYIEKKFDLSSIPMPENKLILEFIHDMPVSPLYIGESEDSRNLTVYFNSIKFS
ncbi:DUF1796 family putative cysteine peptidase [Methanosarcina sp.]|uniref:DUF1796 family putative cysteine peptidase n=1 Tax=Methanosarcina sp. TaxID=2213 RepID=UPI003C75B94C